MSTHRIGEHHAPHPSWPTRIPAGSVILGRTKTGKSISLPPEMRKLGLQIVGLPNQGKSKLMEAMARQDILGLCGTRRSVIFIDPHGPSYTALLDWIVTHGIDHLVPIHLLDLTDSNYVFHLNPLKRRGDDPAVPAAAVTNAILKGVWGGQDPTAMPQARETLKITFATLAEFGAPLIAAAELLELDDRTGMRSYAALNSANPIVCAFWQTVEAHNLRERDQMLGSARRRLNEFLLPRRTREIFSEPENVIDWRRIMDAGEVVLINLSYDAGNVSEDEATTVGTLILADVFLACRGRDANAIRAYVYVDECHRFATEDTARLFTEARKFNCHPILAHQIFEQLDQAGSFVKGSIMSARNKIFFGGLPPDEAEFAARFAYRGQLDLEKPKHLYDKPVVVDHVPVWLRSESKGRTTAEAHGTTSTHGGATSFTESTTIAHSETEGDSSSTSEAHTESESGGNSEGKSSSASRMGSRSYAQQYDQMGMWVSGPTITTGSASTTGTGSSASSASGWGSADVSGSSETHSHAYSESFAETTGTTEGTSWSEGSSATHTTSRQETRGRAEALKPVLKTMPTQGYTLTELVYEAAAEIGALEQGEAVVKIGRRPAEKIKTLRINEGWARTQHIERVKARLAAKTPFIVPASRRAIPYAAGTRTLPVPFAPDSEPMAEEMITAPLPLSPGLKDDGWG